MGRIPGFLLRHRVRVAPPTEVFGQYGTQQQIRCLITRELTGRTTQRVERLTIRAQLPAGDILVDGARVVLPNGQVGYVHAALAHEAGGLPTPDHVEAEIDTAAPGDGGAETVTLLRRLKAGKHPRYGTDLYTNQEVLVPGVAVVQVDATETHHDRADSTLALQIDLTFPAGADVKATDRVRVRGLVFELTGQPLPEPVAGVQPAFTVRARRVTG